MIERIPKIIVIGPVFIDMAFKCETHPVPGKIVEGSGFSTTPSGNGVNASIQIALCGCETSLLARVGEDCFGELIRQHLERYKIHNDLIYPAQAVNTGIVMTVVDNKGENCGCRSFGANRILSRDEIDYAAAEQQIASADAMLIDDEISQSALVAAIRTAQIHKTRIVLNATLPQPNREAIGILDWPMEFYNADVLALNFQGMASVSELGAGGEGELKFIGTELIARGARCVVMSLGWRGALVVDRQGTRKLDGIASEVVDQNGCDSAFVGAFTACFGTGDSADRAAQFAIAAESIQRSRFGLQESLPRKEEIVTVLQSQPD